MEKRSKLLNHRAAAWGWGGCLIINSHVHILCYSLYTWALGWSSDSWDWNEVIQERMLLHIITSMVLFFSIEQWNKFTETTFLCLKRTGRCSCSGCTFQKMFQVPHLNFHDLGWGAGLPGHDMSCRVCSSWQLEAPWQENAVSIMCIWVPCRWGELEYFHELVCACTYFILLKFAWSVTRARARW